MPYSPYDPSGYGLETFRQQEVSLIVLLAETDVRAGGAYQVGFVTAEGAEHYASGRYQEVAPHRRLVFTWA